MWKPPLLGPPLSPRKKASGPSLPLSALRQFLKSFIKKTAIYIMVVHVYIHIHNTYIYIYTCARQVQCRRAKRRPARLPLSALRPFLSLSLYIYIYIHIHIYIYICIYIYIYTQMSLSLYIYIYIYIAILQEFDQERNQTAQETNRHTTNTKIANKRSSIRKARPSPSGLRTSGGRV